MTDSEVAVGVTFGKGALEGVHRGMKAVTGKATLIGDVLYQVTDRVLGATVDSFAEGMQQIQHFTTMGLTGPITFGANRHHGLNAVRLMRAKKAAAASYEQVTGYQTFAPLV